MPRPGIEQEVILCALRSRAGDAGRLRDLSREGPDWNAVRETARAHGVLPLLCARLSESGGDLVPPADMARMKAMLSANARRNLLLGARLLKVLDLLGGRGIAAIPLKGPVLAETAYGDIALRAFSDLDILVRRADMLRAKELLAAQGYRPTHAFTRKQEKAHLARTCEITFEAADGSHHLDLHWRFAADYLAAPLDAEGAFGRTVAVRLLGRDVPSLAGEDLLLFLCLHGTFHLWAKLGLVCDVAKVLESRDDWDWAALAERAAAAGLKRMLLLGVTLARELLAAPVPPGFDGEAGRDRALAGLKADVQARLFSAGGGEDVGLAASARLQLRSKERAADKARYCLTRLLCPTVEDWRRFPLPDTFYFLYFVLRPLRLAGNAMFR